MVERPNAVRRSLPSPGEFFTGVSSLICDVTSTTIAPAASPTDFMVMAENQYGIMAPIRRKAKVSGSSTFTPSWMPRRTTRAPYSARPTSIADPMANPLPMAAVVLPAASSASVQSRTLSGSSGRTISATPPALSQTGP